MLTTWMLLSHFVSATSHVPTIIAVVGAICAPIVAYIAAARRFSGSVESSEAADLWEESRAIREYASSQLGYCREQVATLRKRIVKLEEENSRLWEENRLLHEEVESLRNEA